MCDIVCDIMRETRYPERQSLVEGGLKVPLHTLKGMVQGTPATLFFNFLFLLENIYSKKSGSETTATRDFLPLTISGGGNKDRKGRKKDSGYSVSGGARGLSPPQPSTDKMTKSNKSLFFYPPAQKSFPHDNMTDDNLSGGECLFLWVPIYITKKYIWIGLH